MTLSRSLFVAAAVAFAGFATAQTAPTIGLISHSHGTIDSGYVIFAPQNDSTYLIDMCGKLVHVWPSTQRGNGFVYLQNDGSILRGGRYQAAQGLPGGGKLQIQEWDGTVRWQYVINDSVNQQHLDAIMMPNGNVLVLAAQLFTKQQAIAAGRDTTGLTGQFGAEQIYELRPIGTDSAEVVWHWSAWDHLIQEHDSTKANYGVVAAHPGRININYQAETTKLTDWLHANSLDYNPELDLVMVSIRNTCELWMIDHSTTTAEAATHAGGHYGKGGDLIYRWGNPAAYNRGGAPDKRIFTSHCAKWIPEGRPFAGSVSFINNGVNRPEGKYSSIDVMRPMLDNLAQIDSSLEPYMPPQADYSFHDSTPTNFYCQIQGGGQVLANGNILVTDGYNSRFFEVLPGGQHVWEYIMPVNANGVLTQGQTPGTVNAGIFTAMFYPYSHPAFQGKTLTAGDPVERNPLPYECTLDIFTAVHESSPAVPRDLLAVYPNPASDRIAVAGLGASAPVTLYDCLGNIVMRSVGSAALNTEHVRPGVYLLVAGTGAGAVPQIVSIVK